MRFSPFTVPLIFPFQPQGNRTAHTGKQLKTAIGKKLRKSGLCTELSQSPHGDVRFMKIKFDANLDWEGRIKPGQVAQGNQGRLQRLFLKGYQKINQEQKTFSERCYRSFFSNFGAKYIKTGK